jgi:peptide deformylase
MIRPILKYGDQTLHEPARPVATVTAEIDRLVEDMIETMYAAPGIGLAATQVNVHKQLLILDVSEERNQPLVLVNPKIVAREGSQNYQEGCLSVPGIYADVERADRVTVEALDRFGKAIKFDAEGLLAVCIQHEMDHLDGVLFIDHLSRLKREQAVRKVKKQAKAA